MTRIQWPSTHRSMETCKVLIRDRRNCVFTLVRNIFVNDDISSVQLDSIPPVSCVWNQHVYSFVLSAMRSTTVWMCVCLIVCSQRQYILWSVTGRCFIDAPRINRKETKKKHTKTKLSSRFVQINVINIIYIDILRHSTRTLWDRSASIRFYSWPEFIPFDFRKVCNIFSWLYNLIPRCFVTSKLNAFHSRSRLNSNSHLQG